MRTTSKEQMPQGTYTLCPSKYAWVPFITACRPAVPWRTQFGYQPCSNNSRAFLYRLHRWYYRYEFVFTEISGIVWCCTRPGVFWLYATRRKALHLTSHSSRDASPVYDSLLEDAALKLWIFVLHWLLSFEKSFYGYKVSLFHLSVHRKVLGSDFLDYVTFFVKLST